MGEAVQPIGGAVVSTKAEADEVESYFNKHPMANGPHEIWALVHKLGDPMSVEGAITEIKKAYVFEYYDEKDDE